MSRSRSAPSPFALEKPVIDGLTANDEIDLDELGSAALVTYIRYPGMAAGDEVFPRWVGAAPDGSAFDDVLSSFFVPGGVDPAKGVRLDIDNQLVQNASGGWAFYSYSVTLVRAGKKAKKSKKARAAKKAKLQLLESLRQFCFIGVRPPAANETLSILLAASAHDMTIKPSALGSTMALLVPPYQAMQAGDTVMVTLNGVDDRGSTYLWERLLTVANPGELLQTAVERSWLRRLDRGYLDAHYTIRFLNGGTAPSPVQRYRVDSNAALPNYLPEPTIDGLRPGEQLDPARYRDGITVRVPPYINEGMALSDRVLMHWMSNDRVYEVLRVDPSTLASGSLLFNLPVRWLTSSEGRDVKLGYQFARVGRNLSSHDLTVSVVKSRELSPPLVINAIGETGGGRLPAMGALNGVLVDVPDDADVKADERIEMHWWGHPEQGRQVVLEPIRPDRPRRFRVSADYVAANMERNDDAVAKRFKVFYRLVRKDDASSFVDSEPFMLRILPLAVTSYPRLTCQEADGLDLLLRKVPSRGATFYLPPWPFIANQQWVSVSVQGVWKGEVDEGLWEGRISELQTSRGIEVLLPRATLEQQVINQSFTVSARVSFDGGHNYFALRALSLTLR